MHCEECGALAVEYQIDHIISEAVARRRRQLTKEDGRLLCLVCHKAKTERDAGILARAKRLAAKAGKKVGVGQTGIARRYGVKQEDPPDD
jgi:hypothetical protein